MATAEIKKNHTAEIKKSPTTEIKKSHLYAYKYVVRDLLTRVLKYLDTKELCRVAPVSKFWNEAVKREFQYRCPHLILVYEGYRFWVTETFIRVKPDIALLFTQHDFKEHSREVKVSQEYRSEFSDQLVVVGFEKVYTEKNVVNTTAFDEKKSFVEFNMYEIPGLIIPRHSSIEINIAYCNKEALKYWSTPEKLVDDLLPKSTNCKTILIIFSWECSKSFMNDFMEILREQFQDIDYTIWGSELFTSPRLNNLPNEIPFVGLSIASPNINSYCLILDYYEDTGTVYQKVSKFKYSVKLRRVSFGFISAPLYESSMSSSDDESNQKDPVLNDHFYSENYEKPFLFYVKKLFPTVQFISVFGDSVFKSFGFDSLEDFGDSFFEKNTFSFMIITCY